LQQCEYKKILFIFNKGILMDYQQMRIDSHDFKKAKNIRETKWETLLEETLNGNEPAAKVFCNLLFHFEEDRKRLTRLQVQKILSHISQKGFVYARIVFWVTTAKNENIIEKDDILNFLENEYAGDGRLNSEKEEERDEMIRALMNLGKLDQTHSQLLVNAISSHWNKTALEGLAIINHAIEIPNVPDLIEALERDPELILILPVLKNLIRGQTGDELRKQLRIAIFPSKLKDKESSSILLETFKSRIVNSNLLPEETMAIGDFALCILNNQPARLVYHFGYGRIAGYFYMAKIDPKKVQGGIKEGELSSDEEDLDNVDMDVITGEQPNINAPAGEDMTEEEKEAESERLMKLIAKLEKSGVIQIYTNKEDP
jgi:hypothetical protein